MKDANVLSQLQKDLQPALSTIRQHCITHRKSVAVAESVTAGCLQLILSTTQQAMDFFQGGITAYNCAQKAIHLQIDPLFAESCNAVDMKIAVEMANNVCNLFRAQIGIGITGYATKAPEEGINELFAYIAVVDGGKVLLQDKLTVTTEGIAAQWEYAAQVVSKLSALLGN